jgi:exonuclease III
LSSGIIPAVKRVESVSDRRTNSTEKVLLLYHRSEGSCTTEAKTDDMKVRFYRQLERVLINYERERNRKILLGDFNTKVGREDVAL